MDRTRTDTGNGRVAGVAQRVGQIGDSAHQLFTDARGAVTDLSDLLDLRGRVQRNPYGMLAAAAGLGYLLGGGLFTPTTGRLLRLGMRLAALPFVKDELISMAESAVDSFVAGARHVQGPGPPGRRSLDGDPAGT